MSEQLQPPASPDELSVGLAQRNPTSYTGNDMNDPIELPNYYDEDLAKLSPAELIGTVIEDGDRVPRNVIDECAKRGEGMVDYFLLLNEDDFLLSDDPVDGSWWLRQHMANILGLIPSEKAGLLLVEIMRHLSQEDSDLQDWISGYWPALFLNKPDNVLPPLRSLCEDRNMDCYMRSNAIETVAFIASRKGGEALEHVLAWLASIAQDDDEEDWEFRLSAASMLLHFPREQYQPLLEDLAEQQGGFMAHFSAEEIQQAYAGKYFPPDWERFTDPWEFYQPEAIAKRQIRWREEDAKEQIRRLNNDTNSPSYLYDSYYDSEPYVRPEPKVGRNDPCPCGSGKKYKKCCLTNA